MTAATISEIGKYDGQTVTIHGWLYNLRESGKLLCPIFRDGSGQIQGVVPKNAVSPETFDAIKNLTQESMADGMDIKVDGHEIAINADQLTVDGKTQVLEAGQDVSLACAPRRSIGRPGC